MTGARVFLYPYAPRVHCRHCVHGVHGESNCVHVSIAYMCPPCARVCDCSHGRASCACVDGVHGCLHVCMAVCCFFLRFYGVLRLVIVYGWYTVGIMVMVICIAMDGGVSYGW